MEQHSFGTCILFDIIKIIVEKDHVSIINVEKLSLRVHTLLDIREFIGVRNLIV